MKKLDLDKVITSEFDSLRQVNISGISIKKRQIDKFINGAGIVRFINKYLYKYIIGSYFDRYQGEISFYSSKQDKQLYLDYKDSNIFLNFGAGAFSHFRWKNFDYPSNTNFYRKVQGRPNIDFTPIDLCKPNLIMRGPPLLQGGGLPKVSFASPCF